MAHEIGAFGELLRRFRTAAGLTQVELAERALISVRGISDIERGIISNPRPYTVRQLAEALALSGADLQALLNTIGVPRSAPPRFPAGGLPVERTPLIGREQEIEAIAGRLCEPSVHLVTLTGAGGAGKTRLALAVAARLHDRFRDGVTFVGLQSLTDADLVPAAVAAALGMRDESGRSLTESLISALEHRAMLLVLDNVEHLLPAASLISGLLDTCAGLTMLVTSRTPLRLYGEHEYLVPPLDLPAGGRLLPVEKAGESEAVRLFVARARAVQPAFALTPANASTVAAICIAIDGLPLAIELAAARIRLLSPRALLAQLDQRLRVLSDGPDDVPLRQRSMRETIAWSYALLAPDEQRLFNQLSIFVGGWTLDGAEAVCDQDLNVFDGISRLVDHSLIQAIEQGDGTTRYMMLETVRQYGLEQLEAGKTIDDVSERLAVWVADFTEQVMGHWWGPEAGAWRERIEQEIDTLRWAWAWLERQGERASCLSGRILRSQRTMWRFWREHGRVHEGYRRIEALLAASSPPAAARAAALNALGLLKTEVNETEAARVLHRQALALARCEGDRLEEVQALWGLSRVGSWSGQPRDAVSLAEAALVIARDIGDPPVLYGVLLNLGAGWADLGEIEQAVLFTTEALELARAADSPLDVARALRNLAEYGLQGTGDLVAIEDMERRALALYVEHQGQRVSRYIAEAIQEFARIALARGMAERAARLFGAEAALREMIGIPVMSSFHASLEQQLADTRTLLGDEQWERAWSQGRGMTVDQAIAYALGEWDVESGSTACQRRASQYNILPVHRSAL